MTSRWDTGPTGPTGTQRTLVAQFTDLDGQPWYYARSFIGTDDEWRGARRRIERDYDREWTRDFAERRRLARHLGCNVRDVPKVGDSVAEGHRFKPNWYVKVENGMIVQIDMMRQADGAARTPLELS